MATRSDPADESAPLFCARCAAELAPGTGSFYQVSIDAVADPTPPIISEEELAVDLRQRIDKIIAQMEGMSEQEAMDQVHRRMILYLCVPCYRTWIESPAG